MLPMLTSMPGIKMGKSFGRQGGVFQPNVHFNKEILKRNSRRTNRLRKKKTDKDIKEGQ